MVTASSYLCKIEKTGIDLRSPNRDLFKKYGELVNTSNVFLMRHACSHLNQKMRAFKSDKKPVETDKSEREMYYDLIFDPGNRDASLSEVGLTEVLK